MLVTMRFPHLLLDMIIDQTILVRVQHFVETGSKWTQITVTKDKGTKLKKDKLFNELYKESFPIKYCCSSIAGDSKQQKKRLKLAKHEVDSFCRNGKKKGIQNTVVCVSTIMSSNTKSIRYSIST